MIKSSFNFQLDSSNSLLNRRRKKRQILLFFILLLGMFGYLAVSQGHQQLTLTLPVPIEQEAMFKSIELPDLGSSQLLQIHSALEQEVQHLLQQEFIDPLTKYIEENRWNEVRAEHVATIRAERDRRCAKVAEFYQTQKPTPLIVKQLKKGYQYSCPEVVAQFAQNLGK